MADVTLPTGAALDEYDGLCLELVNDLLHSHPSGAVLYVDLSDVHDIWKYHAALLLDGLVYDAWHPDVRLPPAEYVESVFGSGVEWDVIDGAESEGAGR